MIKVVKPVSHVRLRLGYLSLENDVVWTESGNGSRQAAIQYNLDGDPWTSAVGKSKGQELTYDILNPYFKDTIFEKLVDEFQLKRSRLMWVGPKTCYSMHIDSTPRIHIPIYTNSDCYFIFKHGIVEFLKPGNAYWVDTRLAHTFINCSDKPRLHLVGVVAE